MATSQGNVSPPFFFLVTVGVATWRLEIRLEPGFFFCLTLKEGGIRGEIDWRGRSTGKGVETEGDKGRKRDRWREKRVGCSRRKQQHKPGERDLGERGDKAEGCDCWEEERLRVRKRKQPHVYNSTIYVSWLLCVKTQRILVIHLFFSGTWREKGDL